MTPSRRHFFFGSFALAGCLRVRARSAESLVSVTKAASYDVDLESLFRRIVAEHKLNVAGKRILLKPNLVEFDSTRPINTNPRIAGAARAAFLAAGASEVKIAEGPGHRRETWDMAEAAGYFGAVEGFEQSFTDLNLDDVTAVRLLRPHSGLRKLYLPNTALNADLIVSLPKMKTHHWAGATLSMKNLFGTVPGAVYGWPKNILHWSGIDECIADLQAVFTSHFAIVDGIEGMEGNGPILGSSKQAGVIVAGSHPPSVDEVCCGLMGIDAAKIKYLQLAAAAAATRKIRVIGDDPHPLTSPFALIPELQHLRAGA